MRREAGQLQRGPWIVINACKVVSVLGIWSITSAKRRRKSHYVDGDWVTLMSVSLIARPKLLFVNPYLKEHSSWPTDPKCFISFKTKQPRNTNDRSTVTSLSSEENWPWLWLLQTAATAVTFSSNQISMLPWAPHLPSECLMDEILISSLL